jgi:uncharacterized protein YaaW (UPF0174 family)
MNTNIPSHNVTKDQQIESLSDLLKKLEKNTRDVELTENQKNTLTPLLEKLEDKLELKNDFLTKENNERLNKFGTILTTAAAGAAVGATLISGASIASGTVVASGIGFITNPVMTTALGTLAGGVTGFILNNINKRNR